MSRASTLPPRSVTRRITAILTTLQWGGRLSITEIARITGLPVSTTHRLAWELAAGQVLQRTDEGQYRIGLTLHRLTEDGWAAPTLQERAPCVLSDLAHATGRRARLGVLHNGRVAYVEKQPGPNPVTAFSASATLPAHATALGKALLAFAPQGTITALGQNLTAYTSRTIATLDRLRRVLGGVRLTRIAVAFGELVDGEAWVAAPVFGPGGGVVAALELEVSPAHPELELARVALSVAASGLSRELSCEPAQAGRPRLTLVPAQAADRATVASEPVHSTSASDGRTPTAARERC
jgi:DNA-binding IclR family transcriptional regulator